MPSDRVLERFYAHYSDPRAQRHVVLANAAQNAKYIQEKYGVGPSSRLLDFGCGKNLFVHGTQAALKSRSGNERPAQAARPCDGQNNSPSVVAEWSGYDPHSNDESVRKPRHDAYDVLTLWGVLEHLPRVRETVDRVFLRLLRRRGFVFLTTVSTETGIPYQHKPPEHVTYWTERAMRALFASRCWKVLEYRHYEMFQSPTVYLDCVLRNVPLEIRQHVRFDMKTSLVHVPTNEVFVAVRRK